MEIPPSICHRCHADISGKGSAKLFQSRALCVLCWDEWDRYRAKAFVAFMGESQPLPGVPTPEAPKENWEPTERSVDPQF